MKKIEFVRDNNFLIKNRNLSIFIDDIHVDTIVKGVYSKVIQIDDEDRLIKVKSASYSSNEIQAKNILDGKIGITSKIGNVEYHSIYILFFLSFILFFLDVIDEYMGIALILPMIYIAYHQILKKKSIYIIYSKK